MCAISCYIGPHYNSTLLYFIFDTFSSSGSALINSPHSKTKEHHADGHNFFLILSTNTYHLHDGHIYIYIVSGLRATHGYCLLMPQLLTSTASLVILTEIINMLIFLGSCFPTLCRIWAPFGPTGLKALAKPTGTRAWILMVITFT